MIIATAWGEEVIIGSDSYSAAHEPFLNNDDSARYTYRNWAKDDKILSSSKFLYTLKSIMSHVIWSLYEWSDTIYVYLWIAKDLCWTQSWFYPGIVAASATVIWSVITLSYYITRRDFRNSWLHVAEFVWLLANFLWMYGELHDERNPHTKSVIVEYTAVSGLMMEGAMCWLAVFYLVIYPLRVLQDVRYTNRESKCSRCNSSTTSLLCWSNSHYEDLHVLFWLGKDTAWNHLNLVLWYLFLVPTLLVAVEFVWSSCKKVCNRL